MIKTKKTTSNNKAQLTIFWTFDTIGNIKLERVLEIFQKLYKGTYLWVYVFLKNLTSK